MDRILVIDDDREMGRLLRTLFELEGFEVHVAAEYDDVVPSLEALNPDVLPIIYKSSILRLSSQFPRKSKQILDFPCRIDNPCLFLVFR